ncbi:hypothetical protein AgCh_009544 [Apium graveolens]
MKEYYNYKLMIRPSEGLTPHLGGRLWQQYVVDAFTAMEQYKLEWIRDNQTTIRSDLYHNIQDALQKGDSNPENVGKAIILPASFTGSKRYMNQYFKDALAICRMLGHPSLFLTMTKNTKWPEIQRMLKFLPGVDVVDAPDVVAMVFKMKVDQMVDQIKNENYFGRCIRVMHVIEFQKRGLPYAHMELTKSTGGVRQCRIKKSKLEAWFEANIIYPEAKNFTYSEFPSKFTWHQQPASWKSRKRGDVIGRLSEVHSSSGELIYLRMLLLRIKVAVSFDDLKTVHDHIHKSFYEACAALGLLQNDQQWHKAIAENSYTSMPPQLRAIFVNIVVYSPISHPRSLWDTRWGCMSDDIVLVRRHLTNNPNLCLSDYDIQNYALAEIEKLLNDSGKSLTNFPDMPFLGEAYFSNSDNRLILEETSYDREERKKIHEKNHSLLNDEQKRVYDSILDNINQKKGGVFFVYGSRGNTELENKIIAEFNKWHVAVGVGKETNISPDSDSGTLFTYLRQDSIDDAIDDDNDFRSAFPVEYLNSINIPYIPKHELKLKTSWPDTNYLRGAGSSRGGKMGLSEWSSRHLRDIYNSCNGEHNRSAAPTYE